MENQADVVSAGRLADSLEKALPQLEARARFESAETLGTRELIKKLQDSLGVIKSEPEQSGVMVTFRDPTSAQLQTFLASQAPTDAVPAGGREAKFDSNDILGWFGSFFSWWKKIRPHAWATADAQPTAIADVVRVGLLADWGTGLYGAPMCAQSMAADKAGYQVLMHLGDVYYSGDDKEIQDRFLKLWPKVNGAINLGLNGNHEMYTGGRAYFDQVLKGFGQKASYAALQNNHWLLACLDTAYAEHDLANEQASWLTQLIAQAGSRKVVLFSHHQPYSILDEQGPKLVEKLRPHLEARRIHSWYWGHEHRCVVYEAHPQWGVLGRCVGHSGFPEFRLKDWGDAPAGSKWISLSATNASPAAVVLDGANPYIKNHEKEYGPHGYVTLEFENEKLTEFMHLPDGTVVKSQKLA
jgi:calcineurin-like phosphoesterase family protein